MVKTYEGAELWVLATDEDRALEIAGRSDEAEFDSMASAIAAFDPDPKKFLDGTHLYKIVVEKVVSYEALVEETSRQEKVCLGSVPKNARNAVQKRSRS